MGYILLAEKVMQVNKKGEKITEYIVSTPECDTIRVVKTEKLDGDTDTLQGTLPRQTALELVRDWLSNNLIYKHD